MLSKLTLATGILGAAAILGAQAPVSSPPLTARESTGD